MIKYIVSFEVVPGKYQEFEKFMKEKAFPFWSSFEEVRSIEMFAGYRGSPYEMHFTLDSFSSLERMSQHPSFGILFRDIGNYIQNASRGMLLLREKIK